MQQRPSRQRLSSNAHGNGDIYSLIGREIPWRWFDMGELHEKARGIA
jgi:hypothetical protein